MPQLIACSSLASTAVEKAVGCVFNRTFPYAYISQNRLVGYMQQTDIQSRIIYLNYFTFTGKERDEENGYGYFGARYTDHELMTMWLSVDPMADKYPSISPYAYCAWNRPTGGHEHRLIKSNLVNNPVKLVDPDGRDVYHLDTKTGSLTLYKKTKDKNDIIYAGANKVAGRNKSFKGNGHSLTISKGVLNGKTIGKDISKHGFSTRGGNQKDGLRAAKFISFESHKELSGIGFVSNNGNELDVFGWSFNDYNKSHSDWPDRSTNENNICFSFHTHPGSIDGQGGYGNPSKDYDYSHARQMRQLFNIHQNYIISRHDGVTQYNEWNVIPNTISILPASFQGL